MHLESYLLNEAAIAACWTLVHSLWQGLVLIILTGLVVVATRKSGPALRYRLLSALMILFAVVVATTFAREWNAQSALPGKGLLKAGGHQYNNGYEADVPVAGVIDGTKPLATTAAGMVERVNAYLSAHAVLIVMIWLAILGVRLGRMSWALAYTRRIRRREGQPLPDYWTGRLKELSGQMGLRRTVLLLESAFMKVPVAFGHLKPVIFIPLGLFAKLPPEQAEAILLHELAHIKRDDYLVNLLQSMVEHLFFFNPAILWLSALIREERENCCDDMTIAETGDKKQLVRALIGFRELSSYGVPGYGMGFAGRRNVFVNRIARIVHNKSKGLTVGEGVFFGCSILLVALLAMAFKRGGEQTPGEMPKMAAPVAKVVTAAAAPQDTVPAAKTDTNWRSDASEPDRMITLDVDLPHGKQVLVALHKGQMYRITQVNGVVTELSIGEKLVPADKVGEYQPTIRRIYENLDRVRIDQLGPPAHEDKLGPSTVEDALALSQDNLALQEKAINEAKNELMARMKDLEAAKVDIERQNVDRQALENALKDRELDVEKESKALIDRELQLRSWQKNQSQTGIVEVMLEAVRQKIVSDVDQIHSLHLTKDELLINDKKQPAAVQEAFRKKFLLWQGLEFHFDASDK